MTKLYIIGNGFDKCHNLQTGYDDFHQFVSINYTDIEIFFKVFFQLRSNEKGLWSDFENDLGTFNWKLFFAVNNHLDINDENFRPSFAFCLEDNLEEETNDIVRKIKEAFDDWLNQICLKGACKKIDFDSDSVFLNFNYTLTLEKVYKIPNEKIIHIHGVVEANCESLIFGHNHKLLEESEFDENEYSKRTMFTDSENVSKYPFYAFKKPVKEIISEYESFFESLKSIEEIIILGHSLGSIDIPYFQEIVKQTKNKIKWRVSYYKEKEKDSHLLTLRGIGIEETNIELFRID